MAVSETLLNKVKIFVRTGGSDDDDNFVVTPLIASAKQYLTNAGVTEPTTEDEDDGELNLYELAVTIYVNAMYNGGENTLDQAMTSIILQIRDYVTVGTEADGILELDDDGDIQPV